jgi:hypothetical protein
LGVAERHTWLAERDTHVFKLGSLIAEKFVSLDVWFREDIKNALVALSQANNAAILQAAARMVVWRTRLRRVREAGAKPHPKPWTMYTTCRFIKTATVTHCEPSRLL